MPLRMLLHSPESRSWPCRFSSVLVLGGERRSRREEHPRARFIRTLNSAGARVRTPQRYRALRCRRTRAGFDTSSVLEPARRTKSWRVQPLFAPAVKKIVWPSAATALNELSFPLLRCQARLRTRALSLYFYCSDLRGAVAVRHRRQSRDRRLCISRSFGFGQQITFLLHSKDDVRRSGLPPI